MDCTETNPRLQDHIHWLEIRCGLAAQASYRAQGGHNLAQREESTK